MRTKTIGEMLREERQVHHLTLEELAKRTRIRAEYLEALENNQFEQLPAAVFIKGYIKTYGQIFGFDYVPLLALLRRDFKESARGQLVPREFLKPVLKKQPLWTPVTMTLLGVATAFCTLLGYVLVQWYTLNKPPELVVQSPENNAQVSAQVLLKGYSEPDVLLTVNTQPVALQPDGSFETQVYVPREGINSVTVEAVDRRGKRTLEQRTVYVSF